MSPGLLSRDAQATRRTKSRARYRRRDIAGQGRIMAEVEISDELQRLLQHGYGWRARIGFMSPGIVDESKTLQFYRMAPPGVAFCATSLRVSEITVDEINDALLRAEEATRELTKEQPGCIILGGSPTVVVGGFGSDDVLTRRIAEVSGLPAAAAQTAAVEAMRLLGMHRLVVATPFPDPFTDLLQTFLESSGFEIASIGHLDVSYRGGLKHAPLSAGYELAKRLFAEADAPDGIYFPGAPFPCVDLIELLERELNTTVVSSLQCSLWKGLELCGVHDLRIEGYGRLLRGI
jgi:maleate cis-trans isomerase